MSTHILQEVRSLCSDICIMSSGKLAASGSEEEITKAAGTKTLEEAFIKLTQGVSDLNNSHAELVSASLSGDSETSSE